MANTKSVTRLRLDRLAQLKRGRQTWNEHYQILAEYIMTRKANFTSQYQQGEQLNRDLFDSTGQKSCKKAAAALIGMLWSNGGKSVKIVPPKKLADDEEIKNYYDEISEVMAETMDNPNSGLAQALEEYMKEQLTFGTSGIAVFEDEEHGVIYRSWSIKNIYIDEGRNGFVDTIYCEIEMSVKRLIDEYGYDNVSAPVQKKYDDCQYDDKVNILVTIEPRREFVYDEEGKKKIGNFNMRFESLTIEVQTSKLIKEEGFEEIPVKVCRYSKNADEIYGRSAGMDALPDILELNAAKEMTMIAAEKYLDPALGVIDDGTFGSSGTIDTSAGSVTVFNVTGRAGEAKEPVFPIAAVGEMKEMYTLMELLVQSIVDHFNLDKLLDFNNETQMTLGEAQIRNGIRNSLLNGIFSRQIAELFSPMVERTFNINLRQGKLGVIKGSEQEQEVLERGEEPLYIPDAVVKLMQEGKEVYKIVYYTPAARMSQAEEAEGIIRTWEFAQMAIGVNPEAADSLDADESIKQIRSISGAPASIVLGDDRVKAIRQQRAEMQQMQAQLEAAQMGGKALKDINQAGGL